MVLGVGAIALVPAIGWFLLPAGMARATGHALGIAAFNCWALFLQPPAVGLFTITPASLAVTGAALTAPLALLGMPASRRYLLALLFLRGRLPFRLGRFVRWAYGAGLLRAAGPTYQFRHQELHEWLIMSYYEGGPEAIARAYVSPPR
ncbi:hypothetical protein [Streptomyces sp. NPDC058011]|uniref:hypothetical protein n=1 Tax=Streptomyces sp. NPDC058011 TaxID=3346305 RepID=UPI0036ECAF14